MSRLFRRRKPYGTGVAAARDETPAALQLETTLSTVDHGLGHGRKRSINKHPG